jgi:3-isopropylmalate/(R)-2-methylmalate dehydratase small subunit
MEKFKSIQSRAVYIAQRDIDTDMIIPAQYLTTTARSGFSEALFRRLRDQDPLFPLNHISPYSAQILITQSNFGCGSSREHAVWALRDFGFKVVIAESFADIFKGNALKNGLLVISLSPKEIAEITEAMNTGDGIVTVDLNSQLVTTSTRKNYHFEFDSFRKHCFINGLDDLDYILSHKDAIARHRESDSHRLFFTDHAKK